MATQDDKGGLATGEAKSGRRSSSTAREVRTEPELWQPLQQVAEEAAAFWRDFVDLRNDAGQQLDAAQLDKFVMLARAVSWVESRHGTGTGNYPDRDPMQCGNPRDAWWRQLAGLAGNGDRFVGGPGAKNYWAKELPDAASANQTLPAAAKLSSLANVEQGHRDAAFNPTMSLYWALPHLIWKTNVPKGRKAYQCSAVLRDELIDGATAYNGGGDPDYRDKIDAALTMVGWPPAQIALEPAALESALVARSSSLIEDAMRSIETRLGQNKFFPHGVTKISLSLNLGKEAGFSLVVEGPQQADAARDGAAFIERTQLAMEDEAPPPPPPPGPDEPKPASKDHIAALDLSIVKSIAGAASLFRDECEGEDRYDNNCAHFLSDAFIRAGYTELTPPSDCIHARCATSAKRPIRARDMWCWFKSMATDTRTKLPQKEGLWAVFQLDESEYWGGHVVIIDTDNNVYYGTGNYPKWDQYCYRW